MSKSNPFKWRHYKSQIILRCVRWYLSYPLFYRQVAEMVNERGLDVHHTTVFRWVHEYAPGAAAPTYAPQMILGEWMRRILRSRGSQNICTEQLIQRATQQTFS